MGILSQPPMDTGQQQQPGYNQGYVEPQIIEQDTGDIIKTRLDSSDIMDEIGRQLRGLVWTQDGKGSGSYTKIYDTGLTEEGVGDVMHIIYGFGMNKNIFLGCLPIEEIKQRCHSLWLELAKYAVIAGKQTGFTKRRRSMLIKEIVYSVRSGLSRSENGREANQISTLAQRMEHIMKEERPERSSMNPLNWVQNMKGRR